MAIIFLISNANVCFNFSRWFIISLDLENASKLLIEIMEMVYGNGFVTEFSGIISFTS